VEKIGEHEYNVRASAAITDANEHLPIPLPESEQYDTVSGLVNDAFGRIPETSETINFAGYECTILQKAKRSVALVRLKVVTDQEAQEAETPESH
jgi:CBS domain containing-hemolysin-like protein